MRLFLERGYGATTVPMIAAESGVSRTSVFRYWGSKSEIVWSAFDLHSRRLGELLADADPATATMQGVRERVVENMRLSMLESALWLERFAVLESAPELRSEESAHWSAWADTVADHVGSRHGFAPGEVTPQSIGGAVQAAFLAVLRRRLRAGDASSTLLADLDEALLPLCTVLQDWLDRG
jgi:AcrR family transcriptional regulator